jgi:hypothetical protein
LPDIAAVRATLRTFDRTKMLSLGRQPTACCPDPEFRPAGTDQPLIPATLNYYLIVNLAISEDFVSSPSGATLLKQP